MTVLSRKKIRLAADASKRSTDKMIDAYTSKSPELWRGNDVVFEVGVFFADALVTDISNIATLSLEVKTSTSDRTSAPLMTKTLAAVDLDGSVTAATWADKTAQHAEITFTGDETNIAVGADNVQEVWLVVAITTNDAPGRAVTLGYTILKVVEDGTGSAGDPPNNDPNYYTKGECDSRFAQLHEDQAWVRFHNGRWYHYIQSTGLWYPEVATIVDSIPTLTLGPGESL